MLKVLVFDKNTKHNEFVNYGYGKLRYITSCKVYEELNGRYDLELIVSLRDKKHKYLTKWAVVMVNGQLFRIFNTVKSDKENELKVYANHIFYDLDYGFVEDSRAENKTVAEAMSIGLPIEFNHFKPSSDITDKNSLYFVKDSGVSVVFNIIKRWGKGELVRNNFNYSINKSKGKDKGVTFTYKKVDGIEITESSEEVITRLYPTGKDGIKLKERFIDIPNWNNTEYPPFHITREVKFEAENEGDLRVLATETAKEIGLSKSNFKINVNDLLYTDLYKSVPELMSVEVGDIVTIKHSILDVRVKVKVIKKEIDYVSKKVVIELGQPLGNFFNSVDNSKVAVEIPPLDKYLDGIFYYSNGTAIDIVNTKKNVCYLNFSVDEASNLMVYVNVVVNSTVGGVCAIKMLLDNNYLPLEPKITLGVGFNIISFTYPLLSIKSGVSHLFALELETVGTLNIPKENVQVMIKGQNVSGGLGAEVPHIEVIENIDISVTNLANDTIVRQILSLTFDEKEKPGVNQPISYSSDFVMIGNLGGTVNISLTRVGDMTEFNSGDSLELDSEVVKMNGVAELNFEYLGSEGNYIPTENGNLYSMVFYDTAKLKNVESVEVVSRWQ